MSYIVPRGRNIIALNVRAPSEEKSNDSKDSFYEELEWLFNHFSKYYTKILGEDFNAIVGREDIFKLTFGNDSLHQDCIDNDVKIVNFATSKIWLLRA